MATTRPVTAQVNVDLRATAASMQKMVEDLTKQLAKVDVGSQLGKNLAKELPEIKKQADLFSGFVSQGVLSKQDFAEMSKAKATYDRKVKAQTSALAFAGFSSFEFSGDDLKQLKEINQQIENLKKAKAQIAADTKSSILSSALGSLSGEDLDNADKLIRKLEYLGKLKGFSRDKSVADNKAAIDNAEKEASKRLEDARKELKSFGDMDGGYAVKDLQKMKKRQEQIERGADYKKYAKEEEAANKRLQDANGREKFYTQQVNDADSSLRQLRTQASSAEYKNTQAQLEARIASLETQIATNKDRIESGEFAPKNLNTLAKKQFAENFGAITGLSETKTIGTLADGFSKAVKQMADDNDGILSQSQQQAVTSWMRQKGGINLDANALASVLSGPIDVDAIKTELVRQLGGGNGSKRIGKDLYAQFQNTQAKMAQYGANPNSFETIQLEQDKQRQAEAERIKQQSESAQIEITQLQAQKAQLQSNIDTLQQQRDAANNQLAQAREDQQSATRDIEDAQKQKNSLLKNDSEYQQLEATAQQNAERYDQLTKQIPVMEEFQSTITQLQNGFTGLIETLNRINSADTQNQLDIATEQKNQIINGLVDQARAPGREMSARHELENENFERGAEQIRGSFSNQDQANAEADNFKRQMQASMRQWMGAREIVSYIRRGIQEAYQDIQNLDKAMTNIAVVTDFSVSDLWGQINDYMAMAKQYGVTTQGVYEVTQLFYQQGY